jgi:2'-5' RNA ligase
MRTFIAVFPPPAVQAAVADRIERIRGPGDGISWVKRQNLHYTLRFLGDLPPPRVERAGHAAQAAVVGARVFDAALGAAGAFPDFRRPRVLFFELEKGSPELETLARSVDEALRREGFGPPDKPFRSHLTLGRVRETGGAASREAVERLRGERVDQAFSVHALALVHSRLDPGGSIYRPIAEYPLQAP